MLKFIPATALGLAVVLSGCAKNPADNVTPAQVNEPTTTPAAATPAAPAAPAEDVKTLTIDVEKSTIGFVGSKVTGSHPGTFKTFSGTLAVKDGKVVAAGSKVEIDTASVESDHPKLTEHLKSPDFFDVEKFPTATFTFTDVTDAEIKGDLNFHGVTKNITVPAEFKTEEGVTTITSEFSLMRFDFGIKYPGKADDLIRDEVVVRLNISAK